MALVAVSGLMAQPKGQYPKLPATPQTLHSLEVKDRTGTDGFMSMCVTQADNGARLDTKLGLADAVKMEELGRQDTDGHMLGRGHRPQFCVAQDTGIRQARAPVGTCNPSVGVGRWHPAGAGSGRFPGE